MKVCLTLALAAVTLSLSVRAEDATWIDPAKAAAEDPDFSIQGEYGSGKPGADWGLQVVALGDGRFDGYLLEDGLPGLGWERGKRRLKVSGERKGDTTTLKGGEVEVRIKDEVAGFAIDGKAHMMSRIERESPTLGAKPPEGAVVLFDGTSAEAWNNGQMDGDLLVNSDAISKQKFDAYTLHLEFRTPYKPHARGQKRGNSGVYHQGRYETQILDSFGLEGRSNEAGGIYSVADPKLNMCLPPLAWQTYDVDFTGPKWKNGKKVENARITVRLNGVLIHENQELPKSTAAAKFKESPEPGPIYLQHHGNPIRFRNIWVVPGEAAD
jgi:hypothetical protein